jgi:hypothetical protein
MKVPLRNPAQTGAGRALVQPGAYGGDGKCRLSRTLPPCHDLGLNEEATMHRIILSAMLLLPAAGIAQAQSPTTVACARVLDINNWSSEPSRGYVTNRVDLRNVSQARIAVTHSYNGPGALLSPPSELAAGGFARRELARTGTRRSGAELQAATTLTCVVLG